jgi:hypothetical protein
VLRERLVISAASLNETESGYWGSNGNLLRDERKFVGLLHFHSARFAAIDARRRRPEKIMLTVAILILIRN